MRHLFRFLALLLSIAVTAVLYAQDSTSTDAASDPATQAVAALGSGDADPATPEFVEYVVDLTLGLFGVRSAGNTWQHWAIAGAITVLFYLLRRVVAKFVFGCVRRLTARTETTLDDELIQVWQRPATAFITVLGAITAIKVLKLAPEADEAFYYLRTVALSVLALWFFISTISCVLDHIQEAAKKSGAAVAAFMPWIKKAVLTIIVVFGVLIAAQSLGADVKAFLAGLGIGGLAFALAAQDTLANVFGSVVVAVDQPFRVGEFVQIGTFSGTVEDIGLRSTKLRTPQRTLIAIPNKTVAAEAINNFGRMPERRVDQTIGLTYSSKPEQIEELLGDIRTLLEEDPDVHQEFITVNFLNYGAFSLDIQIIYFTSDPDLRKCFATRERINFAMMRLVGKHGLSFAFPTQTIELGGAVAERLAASRSGAAERG